MLCCTLLDVSRKEATTRRGSDDMRMKKTGIAIIMLLCIASSVTYAWFTAGEAKENRFDMGTVSVEILEEFEPIVDVMADVDYEKVVKVKSNGSKKSYVRVKIFPEWSEPSLPVSNVEFNLCSQFRLDASFRWVLLFQVLSSTRTRDEPLTQ